MHVVGEVKKRCAVGIERRFFDGMIVEFR